MLTLHYPFMSRTCEAVKRRVCQWHN